MGSAEEPETRSAARRYHLRRWRSAELSREAYGGTELLKMARDGSLEVDDMLVDEADARRSKRAGLHGKLFGAAVAARYQVVQHLLQVLMDRVADGELDVSDYRAARDAALRATDDGSARHALDDLLRRGPRDRVDRTLVGTETGDGAETARTLVGDQPEDARTLVGASASGLDEPVRTLVGGTDFRTSMAGDAPGSQPAADLRAGDVLHDGQLPRYRVLTELGRGGQGVVFKVEDLQFGLQKAVKIQHAARSATAAARQRFMSEGRSANRIASPYVVRVDDAKEDLGRRLVYLVMDFVDGGSLRDLLRRNPEGLPVPEVLRMLDQVLSGVEAIHEHGLVHKDLKPENVLLSGPPERPMVRITDLGLADIGDVAGAVGTRHYMAPEQARGTSGVGVAADIYALGVMLLEMLGGRDVPRWTQTCGVAGSGFVTLGERAMSVEPGDRPADCLAFREALQAAQSRWKASGGAAPARAAAAEPAAMNRGGGFEFVEARNPLSGSVVRLTITLPEPNPSTLEAARRGDASALRELGDSLQRWAIERDDVQARREALALAHELFRMAGDLGDGAAMRAVAAMHRSPDFGRWFGDPTRVGDTSDQDGAREWYRRAAEAGDPEGMCRFALALRSADGTVRDEAACRVWLDRAAQKGLREALEWKAHMLLNGLAPYGPRADDAAAVATLKEAAARDSAYAHLQLGDLHREGRGVPPSAEAAFRHFERAHQLGHVTARFRVAVCCRDGLGAARDERRCFELLGECAETRDPEQMRAFALCLLRGTGTSPDPTGAVAWLRRAAGAGDAEAALELAKCCRDGVGMLAPVQAEAARWFLVAGESGSPEGLFRGGKSLMYGIGCARDQRRGRKMIEQAMKCGRVDEPWFRECRLEMASALYTGLGGDRDCATAVQLFRQNVHEGDAEAMAGLSRAYLAGEGVERDVERARVWAEQAKDAGLSDLEYRPLALAIASESSEATGRARGAANRSGRSGSNQGRAPARRAEPAGTGKSGCMVVLAALPVAGLAALLLRAALAAMIA